MDVRKRKRGIRASRSKLEAAMIKAGFETQAALAHRIAQIENIDKPPKDLVSKVFREQAVSTHNLARIAIGLGVDAHTIYLSKEDDEFSEVVDTQQTYAKGNLSSQIDSTTPLAEPHLANEQSSVTTVPEANTQSKPRKAKFLNDYDRKPIILVSLFIVSVVSTFVYWLNQDPNKANKPEQQSLTSIIGKVKIIIQSPEELKPLALQFSKQLSTLKSVSSTVANTPNSYYLSSYEALDKWQAQAVLKLGLVKGPYYQSISATISSLQREASVLQTVLGSTESLRQASTLSQHLLSNTQAFISGDISNIKNGLSSFALAPYLRAKNLAFAAHSAADFKTAAEFFNQALTLDERFTEAYAGLCQTQVRMSWIQDESDLLEQATKSCAQAKQLEPQNIEYKMAQAELSARLGDVEKAIALLEQGTSNINGNSDVLATLAELYLTEFGQSNQQEAVDKAKNYAEQAVDVNPQHWRAYNTLGNLYFSTGDTQSAKQYFFSASKIVKHEVILANLGTLQLCFGELEQAKQTYSDVIANFTSNYIGYESLGSVYLFEQNYAEALKNKLIAIEKQPDISIHQVWAGLAETYLLNRQSDKAWEHYAKALTLIERDELLENISFSDELHKVYYQRKLANIRPQQSPTIDLAANIDSLIEQRGKLGLKARSHLAWLAGEANRWDKKELLWNEIMQSCKVYQYSPELLSQTAQVSI